MTGVLEFEVANVTGTSVDADGFQSTQWDADGEGAAGVGGAWTHHLFGSWGRAADPVVEPATSGGVGAGEPDPAQSAQCLVAHEGGVAHVFDLQHVPTMAYVPTPLPGEHVTYSTSGCFSRHHQDGSVTMATTDAGGMPGGNAIALRVRPTEYVFFAPWGRQTFDAMGYRVSHVGGARFALGFIAGLPAPFNSGQSYARLQADLVELNGSAVSIGPTGSKLLPVAQAEPLVAILASVSGALEAIQLAMATITTTTPGAAAAAASALPVQAAIAAIGNALLAISTQTAIG